jgi:hypothetical protein
MSVPFQWGFHTCFTTERQLPKQAGPLATHCPSTEAHCKNALGAIGHCRAMLDGEDGLGHPRAMNLFLHPVEKRWGNMGKSRVFQNFYSLKKNLGTSLQNIKQLAILNAYQCLPWLLNHRINTWKKHGELRELIL